MWDLALSSLRHRRSAFVATFVAMFLGAAIVTACGALMETGIRLAVPPRALAAADVVVSGDQTYELPKADPRDEEEDVQQGTLVEPVRLDAALLEQVRKVPGVSGAEIVGDAIAVRGKGADNLRAALRGQPVVVLTGDERGLAEFPEALAGRENLIVLAAVFGAMAVMVSMFVVAGTLGLSVQQRRRESALLRAIGTTPGQLLRMIVGEALAVSCVATLLGCLAGPYLGGWLFDRFVTGGVVAEVVEFRHGPAPALAAALVSLLTALVAALVSARNPVSPVEAIADAALERAATVGRLRLWLAALCFTGGVVLALVTVLFMSIPLAGSTAGPAVLLWAIGFALVAPSLVRRVTSRLPALPGPAGHLAVANVKARTAAVSAAIIPVMLATGMATANLYMQTTQADAARDGFASSLSADAVLPGGPGVLEQVKAVPGVREAVEFVTSAGYVEQPHDHWQREEGWPLRSAAFSTFPVTAGSLADLRGDTVALDSDHARNIGDGVGLGDQITLRLGDRTAVRVRVVALLDTPTGSEAFLLPAELLAPHAADSNVLVAFSPGANPEVGAPVATAFAAQQQAQAWVAYLLVGMILAYTGISVVNTQVMATARRRREFGLQRLTGCTRGQVLRMTGLEAAVVGVLGVALGTLASTISLVPFSIAVAGSPLPSGAWWIYLCVVATGLLLTLGATWLPAWSVTRARPVEAAAVTT